MSERVREIKFVLTIDTNKRTITDSITQGDDETDAEFLERAAVILEYAKNRLE